MSNEIYGIYDGNGSFLRIATQADRDRVSVGNEYLVPLQVRSGSSLSKAVFDSFKLTSYPSLNLIRDHSTKSTVGAFVVNLQGVVSSRDYTVMNYQILIDSRSFAEAPQVYILTPKCENILHENIFEKGRYNVLPQREICGLCMGPGFSEQFATYQSEKEKLGFLLHQIEDVLKNPNPEDRARNR
jgi:hypothetical protein